MDQVDPKTPLLNLIPIPHSSTHLLPSATCLSRSEGEGQDKHLHSPPPHTNIHSSSSRVECSGRLSPAVPSASKPCKGQSFLLSGADLSATCLLIHPVPSPLDRDTPPSSFSSMNTRAFPLAYLDTEALYNGNRVPSPLGGQLTVYRCSHILHHI